MSPKPTVCPTCGSEAIAGILYGLVRPDAALARQIAEGRVALGGCVISGGDPRWICLGCKERLGASREWVQRWERMRLAAERAKELEERDRGDRERRGCGNHGPCPTCGFTYAYDGRRCTHCRPTR